jgi:transposase
MSWVPDQTAPSPLCPARVNRVGPGHGSAAVICEIGADPAAWFASAEHLASWAGLGPGNHESAGKRHHGRRRKGNQHLQPVLVSAPGPRCAPTGSARVLPPLGPPVRRVPQPLRQEGGHRGSRAQTDRELIVIIPYQDLGADYFTTRIDPEKERRRLIAKLEAHRFKVTLEPAA